MNKKQLKKLIKHLIREMDLRSLANDPRDYFDLTSIETKINPYDDKDFAMKSKVLNVMSNYIDRKKGTFVKDGISVTQKLVDEVVKSIGNLDLNNYIKYIKLLDKEWSLVSNQYPKINDKYIEFKKDVINQLQ